MRKQTKLVAVLSAAALLAMGASMTSFAAGWEKDDAGVWHYYDKDDEMVTGEWRKDGAKWFYLDEDGDMLTDSWVDDEYYVGADGAMLVNQWAKTASEDAVDDPDEDGDHWFYFGSKGKKISNDKKKIGGKTYFFNEDGEMLSGWYAPNGKDGEVYFLGEEDEGWRAENQWLWLERPTDEDTDDYEWSDEGCNIGCDDEGWYWFGSDGKMFRDAKKKKRINGKDYYFNAHGQMLYEWINTKANDENMIDGIVAEGEASSSDANVASASTPEEKNSYMVDTMRYANQVEDGSRTNGWYEIAGSEDAGTDGDTDWYFFKDGKAKKAGDSDKLSGITDDGKPVYRARIKCNGKYFCFNELGQMQTGLQLIGGYFYYFDDNGYMKTGKVADVEEDDDDVYTYYFETKNGGNGKGITAVKDGYLYWNGKRVEADDDYVVVYTGRDYYLVNSKGKVQKTSKKYTLDSRGDEFYVEIDKGKVKGFGTEKGNLNELNVDTLITEDDILAEIANDNLWIPSIDLYDCKYVPFGTPFSYITK
ncbi:glucan-binding protein [Clostridiaceae bacterium]|nr:glucan-binding protein [Clostridiaceae bacterium]